MINQLFSGLIHPRQRIAWYTGARNKSFKSLALSSKLSPRFLVLSSKLSFGFTLIELIISAGIIFILSAVGIVSYNRFNQDQILMQTAANIKNTLRSAQTKALSGEKICGPGFCGGTNDICDQEATELPFSGWEVELNSASYRIYGVCEPVQFKVKTLTLPGDVEITSPALPNNIVRFKPLTGGVSSPIDICLSGFNKKYKLSVSLSGEIIDYGVVSNCP